MKSIGCMFVGLCLLLAGCDLAVSSKSGASNAPTAQQAPVAPPSLPTSGGILAPGDLNEMAAPAYPPPAGAPPALNAPIPPSVDPSAPPATQQEVAGVGSGIKGRSLDDPGVVKLIAEPARAYFRTRERVVFEVQIPQALNLYKASEGQAPASHDEFMQVIIQANQINLPALPQGHRYVYDPASEQLMVEKPVRQ